MNVILYKKRIGVVFGFFVMLAVGCHAGWVNPENYLHGTQGPQGIQGPAGSNGVDGAVGAQGPQGIQGPVGPQGPAGSNGVDGAVGPQGPAGPAGNGVVLPENPADLADYQWVTNGESITITNYIGAGGALVVPMAINGLPVTRIEANAFASEVNITSITVPEGILCIGDNAFASLDNVTSITLPNSVTNIGFGLMANDPLLGSFTCPTKLTVIPESTFYYCAGLTNVVAPPGLTQIDSYAFTYCGFKSFEIPDGVTEIKQSVFGGCQLTNITFSANITNLGWHAFAGCFSLESARFKGNAPTVDSPFTSCPVTLYYIAGRTGFDEEWSEAAGGFLGLWESEVLYANGGNLTGLTPGQLGAAWKTNSVITSIETNEAGAVVGVVSETIIYLGVP
jgi:hypothetical protein